MLPEIENQSKNIYISALNNKSLLYNQKIKLYNQTAQQLKQSEKEISALNDKSELYNQKTGLYNQTAQQLKQSATELLHLLNEINHIHMTAKKLYVDSLYVGDSDIDIEVKRHAEYKGIIDFPGIGNELKSFGLSKAQDLAAENIFTKKLKIDQRLPTFQQWEQLCKLNRESNKHTASVLSDLKQVDELLSRMTTPPSEQQASEYFYALKGFKNTILDKLSYDLTSKTDRKYFTSLLHRVNNEIEIIKLSIPSEIERNDRFEKVSKTTLFRNLSELSSKDMNKLTELLRTHDGINPGPPTKEDIAKILPSITNFDIKKLGGANNLNWRISDVETGLDLVIQVGEQSHNQKLIEKLELSSSNKYLSTPFFSSLRSGETPFNIVLTELCSGGDLRHEREEKLKDKKPEEILTKATSRMQELTSFCQGSLKNNIIYPDIKLTNCLINSDGAFMITDKKTFSEIDEMGTVSRRDIPTTKLYQPPEMKGNTPEKMNAEAFMCYQIGLAMYNYIVLPKVPTDEREKFWSEQVPFTFDNPIFDTEMGIPIKELLTKILDPDPLKRPSLNEVQTKLQQIYPHNTNQIAQQKGNENKISASYNYRTRDPESGRAHTIKVVGNSFQDLKASFKELRGDALKTVILDEIKSKIEKISSLEGLNELKTTFEKSDEFKVLNTAQGKVTEFLQRFGKNTTSVNILNNMFKEQEDYIKTSMSSQSKPQ